MNVWTWGCLSATLLGPTGKGLPSERGWTGNCMWAGCFWVSIFSECENSQPSQTEPNTRCLCGVYKTTILKFLISLRLGFIFTCCIILKVKSYSALWYLCISLVWCTYVWLNRNGRIKMWCYLITTETKLKGFFGGRERGSQ